MYKTPKVYFPGEKKKLTLHIQYSAVHVFCIYKGKKGGYQAHYSESEHKSQCLLWKRILNSYIAGFIASGIDRTSKESEARQEKTVMASRTVWSLKRKHRRLSNHSHCVLQTITVFDSSIDFGSSKQTNKNCLQWPKL